MKVVQINTVYKNGGSTGRIVYDLTKVIETTGNEAYVAFGYEFKATHDPNTFRIENKLELKLNILKTRIWAKHGYYNQVQTRRLLKWLDTIQPDIIHLHNVHNHYVNVDMLFRYIKEHNIPVVWTLHDCWPFTGWCAYYDYVGCEKWKLGCHHCPNRKGYPYSWFFDRSKSNYERKKNTFRNVNNLCIVTPSEWLKNDVKKSFLCDYPVQVINNGIDLETFHPVESSFKKEHGIGNRKMLLAVFMGASKRKGIDEIYKLDEIIDHSKEVIIIIGLKKNEISNLPKEIIGLPRTNSTKELVEAYSAADVFINPTLEDNFPTTNLEALACGTPVVTYNTGGSPESIVEGCGSVVEKGDINQLYKEIEKIISTEKDSEICIQRAIEKYDKKNCFASYIDLYKKITKK